MNMKSITLLTALLFLCAGSNLSNADDDELISLLTKELKINDD